MIRIRAEINEIENKKSVEKVNENKSWLFENIDKINIPLARWAKKKKRGHKSLISEMKKRHHYRSPVN